jgi:glycosyltransferase involved in cell wall biosynthesis
MFSVVMIVRNEAEALPGALASIRDAPEVVVCDTGSRDGTRDIARKAGARVVDYTWSNDFSAARTFAESHAAHDWIMRLDADERVAPCAPRGLRAEDAIGIHQPRSSDFTAALCALLFEHDASGLSQIFVRRRHSRGNDHWFPRLHRRSDFHWIYPVHELARPLKHGRPKSLALDGFAIEHARDCRRRPYLSILTAAVQSRPTDPYVAFHLGQACWEEGKWTDAIDAFHQYHLLAGGYRFHRGESLRMEGECWEKLGEIDRALDCYVKASAAEGRAEPLWQAANLAFNMGDFSRAKTWCEMGARLASSPPREKQPFGAVDYPYVLDWRRYQAEPWRELVARCARRV